MQFLARLFAFVIVVLLAAGAGAYWYMTPARLKAWMEPRMTAALGRDVTVGEMRLDIAGPGLVISDLAIHERMGFGSRPFLKAERAAVAMSPWAVVSGAGRLGELQLEGAEISLVIDARGRMSTADLPDRTNLRLPVDRVALTGCVVDFANLKTNRRTTVKIQHGRVRGARGQAGIELSGDLALADWTTGHAEDKTGRIGAMNLAFRVGLKGAMDAMDVPLLTVGWGPLQATFEGRLHGLLSAPTADLRAEKQSVDFDRIRDFLIRQGALSDRAMLTGQGQIEARVSGEWPPRIDGSVAIEDVKVEDAERLGVPIVNGDASVALSGDEMRIHALNAQAGASDVSLSGVWANPWRDRSHLSFALASNTLDFNALRPKTSEPQAAWGWIPEVHAAVGRARSRWLALLEAVDLDGTAQLDAVHWRGAVGRHLVATVRARDGVLELAPVTGQLFEGALSGQGTLHVLRHGGDLVASMSVVNASGAALARGLGWEIPLHGSTNMTARLQGAVDTTLTWQHSTTRLDGQLRMAEGQIVKWDALQRELSGVEQLGLLTADAVSLRNVMVLFRLTGNRLALDGTRLTAADLPCQIGGSGELDGRLNYTLDVDVPASKVSVGGFDLGRALGTLLGRDPTIPVRVSIGGTSAQPEVSASIR